MKPSSNDTFRFLQAHRPVLEAGDYTITLTLQDEKSQAMLWATPPTRSAEFSIAGDRLTLHPALLRSCFPPPGAHGEFHGVLPHLIFHRSTLPWERRACDTEADGPPWFALVCFHGDQAPAISVVRAATLVEKTADAPADSSAPTYSWRRRAESADDPDAAVTVIDVPRAIADDLLPPWNELPLTAHVRTVTYSGQGSPGGEEAGDDADELDGGDTSESEHLDANTEECALVVSRDLILATATPQHWVVHLVSLEEAYVNSGDAPSFRWSANSSCSAVRLVSLFHWEFTCEAKKPDFAATAKALDVGPFRLPEAVFKGAPPRAQVLAAQGSVPLPHPRRDGGQDVAWVRGPLVPWTGPSQGPPAVMPLPARSADALVVLERGLGMADLTYAVAWELGRMSALANRSFSTRYATWKRARAGSAARLRAQIDSALLPAPTGASSAPIPDLPAEVTTFFRSLATLGTVPPIHLVPHRDLLPLESMRVVRVDTTWVECLLDGAQAIGRHSAHEAARDATGAGVVAAGLVGVILRSSLVEDHPDLEVHGWKGPDTEAGALLDIVLDRKLGPGTRLVLFGGEPTRVSLGLPPTVLHFGFDVNGHEVTVVRRSTDPNAAAVTVQLATSLSGSDGAPGHDVAAVVFAADDPTRACVHLDRVAAALDLPKDSDFPKLVADLMESAPRVDFDLTGGT